MLGERLDESIDDTSRVEQTEQAEREQEHDGGAGHAGDAAAVEQLVDELNASVDGEAAPEVGDDFVERVALIEAADKTAEDRAAEQRRDGRDLARQQDDDEDGRQQRHEAGAEVRADGGGDIADQFDIDVLAAVLKTDDVVQDEADERRGNGDLRLMLDAGEQVDVRDGGGNVGAVGHRGDGIAEERARADGAGRHDRVDVQADADTGQRKTRRAERAPGRARDERADGAEDERRGEEHVRRDGLHAEADDERDRAGGGPCTDQRADAEDDHDGDDRALAVGDHAVLKLFVRNAERQAQDDGDEPCDQEQSVDLRAPCKRRDHDGGEHEDHDEQRVTKRWGLSCGSFHVWVSSFSLSVDLIFC